MKKILLQIVTAVTFLSPNIIFAQAPTLGSAANFVIFSSNGAVTNGGINSHLTGNVGTNSGALSGFGNVNGVMHNADVTSGQCAADLQIAYDQLNNAIPTFYPSSFVIGNGDTLVAGVYNIAGVTTLDSILYLNAAGNSSAVFIFQIENSFSTNPFSKIRLLNGAQACNVFWKVEGLVSMGSSTSMKGTVIAHNAAINMNPGDTLEGRAMSTTGAVTVSGILAYTPIGCGSAVLTGPAAANLASAACYTIFSGNGAVTNSGISRVTGDIGTNVGLTTGYDPLYVTGMIHPIPDVSTAACAADLQNAYNYLNLLPVDIELLYPAQFGNDLVLTPHTYLLNAATTFTGNVYLDAQGNSNAVFVMKLNGALSTSTFSKVILLNGAQAKNIFWKVEGAVSINDYSVFNGTIIANNGAVSLSTGDSLYGRAFTTTGAFTTADIVAIMPSNCLFTLPVNWLYFRGKAVQKNVLLEWGTGSDMKNGFFTIEKSMDGNNFKKLATVNVTGTVNVDHNYSFTDQQPYALSYYRISHTDNNAQVNYYQVVQVKMNITSGLHVTSYTQGNYIYIQVSGANASPASIGLFGTDGGKISSQNISLTKEVSTYKIARPLNKGIYYFNIIANGQPLYNGKIISL